MNNFYLTLLSDSSLSTFSKNTQCDFKVKLDHSIQIEKDNWEVGLVEVITPTEVNNITKENNYVILRFTDRKMCEDIDNCTKYDSYVDQKAISRMVIMLLHAIWLKKFKKVSIFDMD